METPSFLTYLPLPKTLPARSIRPERHLSVHLNRCWKQPFSCIQPSPVITSTVPDNLDWFANAAVAHAAQSPPNAHSIYVKRRPKPPFFEGWYLRLTLPNSDKSYAFIFAIEAPSLGCIQILDPHDTLHVLQLPPDSHFKSSESAWTLSHWGYVSPLSLVNQPGGDKFDVTPWYTSRYLMQGWHVDALASHGYFVSGGQQIQWAFDYQPSLSWGSRGQGRHTGTWLANFSIFEPGYQVLMAHGQVSDGYIKIGDERIDVKGSTVYAEKNWGRSFPSRWFWIQCNTFWSVPDLCVVAVGALRKVVSLKETIGLVAVHHEGRMYEFSNWSAISVDWIVRWGKWSISSESRNGFRVKLSGSTDEAGKPVLGPTENGMKFTMRDTMRGHLQVALTNAFGKTIVKAESTNAQLEVGGEPWSEEWVASVPPLKQPLRGIVNYFNKPKVETS